MFARKKFRALMALQELGSELQNRALRRWNTAEAAAREKTQGGASGMPLMNAAPDEAMLVKLVNALRPG